MNIKSFTKGLMPVFSPSIAIKFIHKQNKKFIVHNSFGINYKQKKLLKLAYYEVKRDNITIKSHPTNNQSYIVCLTDKGKELLSFIEL